MQSRGQRDYLFDFIHEEEATIAVVVVGLSYIDGHVAEPSTGCNYMVRDQRGFFPIILGHTVSAARRTTSRSAVAGRPKPRAPCRGVLGVGSCDINGRID